MGMQFPGLPRIAYVTRDKCIVPRISIQDIPMVFNEALPPYQGIFRTVVKSHLPAPFHAPAIKNCNGLAVQGTANVRNMKDKIDINSEAISFSLIAKLPSKLCR